MSVADPSLMMFTHRGAGHRSGGTHDYTQRRRQHSDRIPRAGAPRDRPHQAPQRSVAGDPAGRDVLGYVESFPTPVGERYRAKRLVPRQGRFLVDGEFWSMNDAVECLC